MKRLLPVLLLLSCSYEVLAYDKDERASIDIDRRSIAFNSQVALEKSREYIRRDSTYYIGWMYWGAYLFNRANDERGFTQAIEKLEKAFDLIERDYDAELRTRTNDLVEFVAVNTVQNDYSYISNWLQGSYQNVERAQDAYVVLTHVKERDLQFEAAVESWNTLAWLYHRNRMYTSARFPFLKNSVRENDSMAYVCLDSAIIKINRDNEINQGLFDPTFMGARYYFTYHYKAILFTYDFELDSADLYYNILLNSGYYSSNNYANYMYMKGEFGIAEAFYKEAEDRDNTTEKHTREYFYMRGLLEVYRGTPGRADSLLSRVIEEDGFTPGYGWHSIALSRALMYEGLTTVAQRKLNNAARFQELHIGTTWGQEQYNLSVAVLNYMNSLRFEKEYYFENNQWYFWFNPVNWYRSIEYKIKVHHFRLVMVSLVAANPERGEVLYPMFSSENLLGWDETWQMLDGFSNEYFIKLYEDMLEKDPRVGVRHYIKFILGRLYLSDGNEEEAIRLFEEVQIAVKDHGLEFDKLLYARACESLAEINSGDDNQNWLISAYDTYPQLVPFSEGKLNFHVTVDGKNYDPVSENFLFRLAAFTLIGLVILSVLYIIARWYFRLQHSPKWIYMSASGIGLIAIVIILVNIAAGSKLSMKEQVLEGFSECNIGYTENQFGPKAELEFVEADSTVNVKYKVTNSNDEVVNEGTISVNPDKPNQAGIVLAYRLFKIDFTYSSSSDVDAEEVGTE